MRCEPVAEEMQTDAIVGRIAAPAKSPRPAADDKTAGVDFAVIMRAIAAGQKAETFQRSERAGNRIGHPLLEPTNRAGTHAGQHHPAAQAFRRMRSSSHWRHSANMLRVLPPPT